MIRLLYVPNETEKISQIGFRRPLWDLREAGLVEDVKVVSLQIRVQASSSPEYERRRLAEVVRSFKPTHVLIQHPGFTGLRQKHLQMMRHAGNFRLIYHEADPYSRFAHRLPEAARSVARESDVAFTVGTGLFRANLMRAGANDVRYEPHQFEPDRYLGNYSGEARPFHVVVVANRSSPRFKFRGVPSWRTRIEFVELLQKRFGSRLGLFGRGWSGPGAQGSVPFSRQDEAVAAGYVSANWDHYDWVPHYFSNRLPISLSVGGIHATTWHPGYDDLFGAETAEFLLLGRSPQELVTHIERRLDAGLDSFAVTARSARAFAYTNFRQDDQLVRFLNFDGQLVDPMRARESWVIGGKRLEEL